jgi:tRNA(Ile)-lysidine synthase
LANRVEIAFLRAARAVLPARGSILVAVSGGGDSIALLHLLARSSIAKGSRITVAHLDHGLRPGSAADRRFVERVARDLGHPLLADRRPVPRLRRRDESPEEAARRVRRQFLLESAAVAGAAHIALGHTLDDQAETILMRLARGAGSASLAAMSELGPGPFVRPLLGIERAELRAWLARRGIAFREDPSNRDERFDRNRVRRLVMPALARALNPSAARHLVEAAGRLREDALCLDGLARDALERALSQRSGAWSLAASALAQAPRPVALRMARELLQRAGADPRRIGSRPIEAVVALAAGGAARSIDLPSGLRAARSGDRIVVR